MGVDRRRFAGNQFSTKNPEERFWAKVLKASADECWLWTASVNKTTGYGAFSLGTTYINAHAYSYQLTGKKVPRGYTLDHLCHSKDKECPGGTCIHRTCVNPTHLEPVPRGVNTLRGNTITAANVAKTHCPQGHAYTPENTYNWGGKRTCKTCHRAKTARQRLAKTSIH